MMSLIDILHHHVESNFAGRLISDIAVAFQRKAVVDIHKNLMTYETVSKFINKKLIRKVLKKI